MEIVNLAVALLLLVNSLDLLYLYFMGAWSDPIKWIKYTEVVAEFVIAAGALAVSVILLRKIIRENKDKTSR